MMDATILANTCHWHHRERSRHG